MNPSTATLVVIPTYDEAENIEPVVTRLRAAVAHADVLVVDDGSPDGTGDIADRMADADDQVNVMHRTEKAGLGAAYLAGFGWGLDRGYDVICEMDADGSHLPEQLPRLLDAIDDADLVIGSRWIPGGAIMNWPRRRELLSRGANTYVRTALGLGIGDATAGFRAFTRDALESIDLDGVESQGYCFQVDLTRRVVAAGLTVHEVPITFVEREHGVSKMTGSIVREGFVKVGRWGLEQRGRQARALASRRRS